MKEQTYEIEQNNSFNLKHILECGQCFRWIKEKDESYTGVFKNNVLNVRNTGKTIKFEGICDGNIKDIVTDYFDLNQDYEEIKKTLSKVDEYIKTSIAYGNGIRILHQDLWETLISFIISANNNIPRIKGIIEKISKNYGEKIIFRGRDFYTFPTPEQLSQASLEDLRKLGLGFRDKRIYDTTRLVLDGKLNLKELEKEKDINILREKLLEIPGVGPKVADCVMLFSLKRYEVFPIDVWVRRVMSELYFEPSQKDVPVKQIQDLANTKYGNLAGIAQQYLFYWRRESA